MNNKNKNQLFIDRLYGLSDKKNLSIKALARETNVSASTFSSWKNGTTPNIFTMNILATYLGCTLDYLIGNLDYPKNTIPIRHRILDMFAKTIFNYLSNFDFSAKISEDDQIKAMLLYRRVKVAETKVSDYLSDFCNDKQDLVDIKISDLLEFIEIYNELDIKNEIEKES